MTVKELIAALEELDGDMEVVVKYRDEGGEYSGNDSELYLDTSLGKLVL